MVECFAQMSAQALSAPSFRLCLRCSSRLCHLLRDWCYWGRSTTALWGSQGGLALRAVARAAAKPPTGQKGPRLSKSLLGPALLMSLGFACQCYYGIPFAHTVKKITLPVCVRKRAHPGVTGWRGVASCSCQLCPCSARCVLHLAAWEHACEHRALGERHGCIFGENRNRTEAF